MHLNAIKGSTGSTVVKFRFRLLRQRAIRPRQSTGSASRDLKNQLEGPPGTQQLCGGTRRRHAAVKRSGRAASMAAAGHAVRVNHSGGSPGADAAWRDIGAEFGVRAAVARELAVGLARSGRVVAFGLTDARHTA